MGKTEYEAGAGLWNSLLLVFGLFGVLESGLGVAECFGRAGGSACVLNKPARGEIFSLHLGDGLILIGSK